MKSILKIILLLSINFSIAQSLFKEIKTVDEFGDEIGSAKANISFGTFSNSATNNSSLSTRTVLEEFNFKTVEEYRMFSKKQLEKIGYSEKLIEKSLKYIDKSFKSSKNTSGYIEFELFEYNEHLASHTGIEHGSIAIKLSNGTKLRSLLSLGSFALGGVTITGYKARTKGALGVEYQIKKGLYHWEQTDIYNAIINSQSPIDVVIQFGGSTYKFTMELPKTE